MSRRTIELSAEDLDALARVAAAEAGNQNREGRAAVVATILNRVASDRFPDTVQAVINQDGQFEPVTKAGGDWRSLPEAPEPVRQEVTTSAATFRDPTGGATFFANPEITDRRGTTFNRSPISVIGDHAFFDRYSARDPVSVPDFGVNVAGYQAQTPPARPSTAFASMTADAPVSALAPQDLPTFSGFGSFAQPAARPDVSGRTLGGYQDAMTTTLTPRSHVDMDGLSFRANRLAETLAGAGVVPQLDVVSAYRSPGYNARVGGASNSRHTRGDALDVSTRGMTDAQRASLLDAAIAGGARGVGIYPSGSMHFDVRESPGFWGVGGSFAGAPASAAPEWARPALENLFAGAPATPVRVSNAATPPPTSEAMLARGMEPPTQFASATVPTNRTLGGYRAATSAANLSGAFGLDGPVPNGVRERELNAPGFGSLPIMARGGIPQSTPRADRPAPSAAPSYAPPASRSASANSIGPDSYGPAARAGATGGSLGAPRAPSMTMPGAMAGPGMPSGIPALDGGLPGMGSLFQGEVTRALSRAGRPPELAPPVEIATLPTPRAAAPAPRQQVQRAAAAVQQRAPGVVDALNNALMAAPRAVGDAMAGGFGQIFGGAPQAPGVVQGNTVFDAQSGQPMAHSYGGQDATSFNNLERAVYGSDRPSLLDAFSRDFGGMFDGAPQQAEQQQSGGFFGGMFGGAGAAQGGGGYGGNWNW